MTMMIPYDVIGSTEALNTYLTWSTRANTAEARGAAALVPPNWPVHAPNAVLVVCIKGQSLSQMHNCSLPINGKLYVPK